MGARVGGELVAAGHEVRWLPDGRSEQTAARARLEGLTASSDPAALLDGAGLVLSVVPPQARARDGTPRRRHRLLRHVRRCQPALARHPRAGPRERRGGRSHPRRCRSSSARRPARVTSPTSTWQVTRTWSTSVELVVATPRLVPVVVGDTVGQASAAKQSYALFNKGRLVLAALAAQLADAHGVRPVLAAEQGRPGAAVLGELGRGARRARGGRLALGPGARRAGCRPGRGRCRRVGGRGPRGGAAARSRRLTGVRRGLGHHSARG